MSETTQTMGISVELRERAAGCLVGAALGDAFGMPLEFNPPPAVQVRELRAGRLPAGSFTDDTEMMLALAASLLARRPLDAADLAARFVDWLQRRPSDVGIHTQAVLERVDSGMPWKKAVLQVQAANPEAAGNGSVMRCFPVALACWDDLEACIETSRLQSRVTHAHPECQAACAFVNAVIWHALRGVDARRAVAQALAAVPGMPDELREVIAGAPARQAAELLNTGWVRHTVESAVWGLLTTGSYVEAVIRVGNLGQDADTAAAVVGAMAGAVYGLRGIPADWRAQLRGAWPIRGERTWGTLHFAYLASSLLERRTLELESIADEVDRRSARPGPAAVQPAADSAAGPGSAAVPPRPAAGAPASTAPLPRPATGALGPASGGGRPASRPTGELDPSRLQAQPTRIALRIPSRAHFRGALLGGAIGDALGLPFEGRHGNLMRSRQGKVSGYSGLHGRPARISDDTQLTICVAECLVANGWLDPADLARRLVAWLPQQRGAGATTLEAIGRLQGGTPWHQAGAERSGGNGAAMRSAPVGLLYWNNPPRMVAEAILSSLPTHSQPVGVAGAVAMAAATSWLLAHPAGSWRPEEFVAAVQRAIAGLELASVEDRKQQGIWTTLHERIGEIPGLLALEPPGFFDRFYSGGFVLESLPAAFYCFLRSPEDVERAIITAVNHARDADTVAAMAGTLGGALAGEAALPHELAAHVERRDELIALADRLWEMAAPG